MRRLILLLVAAATSVDAAAIRMTSDLLDFTYSWPAVAAAIPRLDARMRADAARNRARALAAASADRRARGKDFPFHQHDSSRIWRSEGEAGGLLALQAENYDFTGGAHGNTGWQALLWSRAGRRPVAFSALFSDWPAAERRLVAAFCPALDQERARRRGAPVKKTDMFGDCPKLCDQVLVPTRVRGGRFTAVKVLIGPYEAGPYAEGSYAIVLPLDPRLVAPEWRKAFG